MQMMMAGLEDLRAKNEEMRLKMAGRRKKMMSAMAMPMEMLWYW